MRRNPPTTRRIVPRDPHTPAQRHDRRPHIRRPHHAPRHRREQHHPKEATQHGNLLWTLQTLHASNQFKPPVPPEGHGATEPFRLIAREPSRLIAYTDPA